MKRPSGSISGGSPGPLPMIHSGDGFGTEDAEEDMVSDLVPANGEKKRRLSTVQVRALERSFETDNKLEPERKARLARDLGLQPRQVAVWFQNRRARWKTKQLERDYAALRHSYDDLRRHNDKLLAEIKELKANAAMAAAQGSSDSDSSGVVNDAEPAPEEPPPLPELVTGTSSLHGELFFHGHLLKLEEDEAAFLGDDDAACGGFFADLQPPPSLPW